jgi:uncharacterized protein YjbI with pentapeptide repeats
MLACEEMATRITQGPPTEVTSPANIEKTTGTMIAHGVIAPARLYDVSITEAAWRGFCLFGLHFVHCHFDNCDLSSSDLRGVSFVDCQFDGCRFDDADMAGSYVHSSTFDGCSFVGARLVGAEVSRSEMRQCRGWPDSPDAYRNEVRDV